MFKSAAEGCLYQCMHVGNKQEELEMVMDLESYDLIPIMDIW